MDIRKHILFLSIILLISLLNSCHSKKEGMQHPPITLHLPTDILHQEHNAFCYGGYRENTREITPSIQEVKEDLKILNALGTTFIRTYNTQQYSHARITLEAIQQLKQEIPDFEMHVMLGVWMECQDAWSGNPDHTKGNIINNIAEITAAIDLTRKYPDIVKIIAVGNEAMVHWAGYHVTPKIITDEVVRLKTLRQSGLLPQHILITSSDNYASWGGGSEDYHTEELNELISEVDFISLHTYPFHDTHYNASFWTTPLEDMHLSKEEKIRKAIRRSSNYAQQQYHSVKQYLEKIGIKKPIHIGETGWATTSNSLYGNQGSKAADEYKAALYYQAIREWTKKENITCFYFEAFDEKWKDAAQPLGSENHFGLINLKNEIKYALWDEAEKFNKKGLKRNNQPLSKSYFGDKDKLINHSLTPPSIEEMGYLKLEYPNNKKNTLGETILGKYYIIQYPNNTLDAKIISYPSSTIKLNAWEGTCHIKMNIKNIIEIQSGTGNWWGCGLELENTSVGENLNLFKEGSIQFEIRGNTQSSFFLGYLTGHYTKGNLKENAISFGPEEKYSIHSEWQTFSIPVSDLNQGAVQSENISAPLFIKGKNNFDGGNIEIRNIFYSQ